MTHVDTNMTEDLAIELLMNEGFDYATALVEVRDEGVENILATFEGLNNKLAECKKLYGRSNVIIANNKGMTLVDGVVTSTSSNNELLIGEFGGEIVIRDLNGKAKSFLK